MKQKKIKEERKESEIKAEQNGRLIENKIIRDIRTLFEQEEDYYKPKRVVFGTIIILNMKVMMIKPLTYH